MSIAFRMRFSIIIVIGTALLPINQWFWLTFYGAIAVIWSIILKPQLLSLTKLLGVELIGLALLSFPLGREKAGFLLVRSLICLLVMNSVIFSLPPHSLTIALKSLILPSGLKENVLLAGQYLEILLLEISAMQKAAKCRGLSGPASWRRYVTAGTIGSLYLRTKDRAERIYQAMLIRGYHGNLPVSVKLTQREIFYLWFTVAMVIFVAIVANYSSNLITPSLP